MWNNIKWSEEKRNTLEEIVARIFLNVMKAVNPQTKKRSTDPWGGGKELIENLTGSEKGKEKGTLLERLGSSVG